MAANSKKIVVHNLLKVIHNPVRGQCVSRKKINPKPNDDYLEWYGKGYYCLKLGHYATINVRTNTKAGRSIMKIVEECIDRKAKR